MEGGQFIVRVADGVEDAGGGADVEGLDAGEGRGGGKGEGEGVGGGVQVEVGAEEGVGGLEVAEGGLEEGEVGWFGEEEGEDGYAGAGGDGLAPAVLGAADGAAGGVGWGCVGGLLRHRREREGGRGLDCGKSACDKSFVDGNGGRQ